MSRRSGMTRTLAVVCALLQWCELTASAQQNLGQQNLVAPEPGQPASPGPSLLRPYARPAIPPIRVLNSSRLHGLIRSGILYLGVADALALAIENNLDLEIQRYSPVAADWNLQRQQGGGPLRGAPANASQVGAVASGQGVLGSEASVGLQSATGGSGGGGGGSNSSVQQVGTVAPNYDPVFSNSTTFSHVSAPQYNQTVSEIPTLVDDTRTYQTQVQQGLPTGGLVRLSQTEDYLNENSPGDYINPTMAPNISLVAQQPLLQGLGVGVNTYYIRVAKNNVQAQRESFRSQMLDLAANVLNLYWSLVSAEDSVRAAQQSLEIAQKFDDDTRQRIRLGTLANYQAARADAELARNQQALALAQMEQRQSELALKSVLSRAEDPELEAAQIMTTDRMEVPSADDLPPLRELVAKALAGRPDLAVAQINDQNQEITSVGTRNNLLPTGGVYARATNTGDAASLAGGFGQVVRRDLPQQYAGAYFGVPLNNRAAQADYAIDQLQLQQAKLTSQRNRNGIVEGISNQVVALQQARAGYAAAVSARELQEQLYQAEQDKFSFGSSTIDNVVLVQRALVAAQNAELAARGGYAHARVSLDQMLGTTLDVNHLTLEEGLSGHVNR